MVAVRVPAEQRRRQMVDIALRHFAVGGYNGTSTEAIAAESGVSQPYLFRLFKTKRELFLACCAACNERIKTAFHAAADDLPAGERRHAMGGAYVELLRDKLLLRFQLQMYAACSDDEIRIEARRLYRELIEDIRGLIGTDALWDFLADGMLLNVIATLGLDETGEEWEDPKSLLC
jgi:AcrR family transcriptional regulator